MVHINLTDGDRYEVIIDGTWSRYTADKAEAEAYAAKNGNASVLDMETGKVVGRW